MIIFRKGIGFTLNGASTMDNKTIALAVQNKEIKLIDIKSMIAPKINEPYFEYLLQSKLEGITLIPTDIPYMKPQWSKSHPFHWEDKAEAGDAEAMYQLGIIYDRDGENEKALDWYNKALIAGHQDAQERIKFLEKWMKENPDK